MGQVNTKTENGTGVYPRSLFLITGTFQAGAFIGTLIVFPLVNVFNVFRFAEECFGE